MPLRELGEPPVQVWGLTEGGQEPEEVAAELGDRVAGALRDAASKGVALRLLYNLDSERPVPVPPPPATRPEMIEALPFPTKGVPGIPDLMHHKYAVRDGRAVWTGSTNWTLDSWRRQENVLVAVESEAIAGAY